MRNMTIDGEPDNENEDNEERGDSEQTNLELELSSSSSWVGSSRAISDAGRSADSGKREQSLPPATMPGCSTYTKHGLPVLYPEVEGPSSSDLSVTLLENSDILKHIYRDFQHKRPKVLSYHESNIPECSAVSTDDLMDDYILHDYENMENSLDSEAYENDHEGTDAKDDKLPAGDSEVRMDLAEDLLHLVFSFLSHKDLCKAGATCKQWHTASSHEEFWRSLNFKDMNITPENFAAICQRYPNATQVNLLGVPDVDVLVMEALATLRKMESLTLGTVHGTLADEFFLSVTECSVLKCLKISDMSLGSGLQEIALDHDRLNELEIVKCRVLRLSIKCPQLKKLSLRRTTMTHVLLNCPLLNELDISACHKLSDAGIRSAAMSCPHLTSLDMSSCSCVSDETLRDIARSCPNLQVLNASFCPNISLESVRLPMLTKLELQNCEAVSSASIAAIACSSMLEELQLDCCSLLTSVSLDLPRLHSIRLVHCRKFVDLNLRCPKLSCVKVSNCPALHRINLTSYALQKLVLQKQESLVSLSLQCPSLLEVDLSDCELLDNSVCEVFSDGGGCLKLRSLILDNCESVTEVVLISSSLINLSLIGCRAMSSLELSCPNLEKVHLDGCDHLERASFFPVGLRSLNLGICPKLAYLSVEAPNMLVLELQGCGVLSSASITCPRLLSLDASFCSQLKDDSLSTIAASCRLIQSLVLSSCLSIGFDGLCSLRRLQNLAVLDLSYTFLVDLLPIFKSCSQLVTLRLMACKYLTDTSLDALYKEGALPTLRELDLSYSSIGQSAIEGLLTFCTNLTNVNLNGCANMHDLVWGLSDGNLPKFHIISSTALCTDGGNETKMLKDPGRLLETLNCVGCPNIRKVVIPPTACCFYLTKLNLHLSANLKEVDIACPNLISLNLSHCSSLEILKLNCPRLAILILLACGMITEVEVEKAISGCISLETLNLQHCAKIQAVNLGKLRLICPSLKRIHSGLWNEP